jgi:hypothetical protein
VGWPPRHHLKKAADGIGRMMNYSPASLISAAQQFNHWQAVTKVPNFITHYFPAIQSCLALGYVNY